MRSDLLLACISGPLLAVFLLKGKARRLLAAVFGGMVSVTVSGKRELKHLEIKPECVDPEDVEMLQDMILAAVNEALRNAEETRNAEMAKLAPGMGGMF